MSIEPGTRLGQYEVQEFIGQGAMGLVYKAYHPQLERTGAVKVLQGLAPDADSTARFRHEAMAIAQMRHPNILNVYDFGEYSGAPYMIVEYVPGGSLAGRLNQGRLDHATALRYLRGIAAGLDYAHAHGIVHRDVKPANVLLEQDDTPVLADFGLAKLLQGSSLKSMTGVTTGTPAYMAPEQVTGSKVGPAADRYSLATIAYEMLTGVIPFDGEAVLELLYAQVHRDPPAPSSRSTSLGPRVDAAIMRGLAKDPEARWPSCTAFVDALTAALSRASAPLVEQTVAMAPGVASTAPLPDAAPALVSATAPPSGTSTQVAAMASTPVGTTVNPDPLTTVSPPAMSRSHRVRNTIVAAALIITLLIAGGVAYVLTHLPPAISLSSSAVVPGEHLVVNGSHLPANQSGFVQVLSQPYDFPFQAGPNGNFSVEIVVPTSIGFGDHIVRLCWSGFCHAQTTLHVNQGIALSTPSAAPTASPSSGVSPTSPTPTPSGPYIRLLSQRIQYLIGMDKVYGFHYFAGRVVVVSFVQGAKTYTLGSPRTGSNGDFSLQFMIPPKAQRGSAQIEVCAYNGCLFTPIEVTVTG